MAMRIALLAASALVMAAMVVLGQQAHARKVNAKFGPARARQFEVGAVSPCLRAVVYVGDDAISSVVSYIRLILHKA